ncbi:Dynamin family protein [Gracilibacillus halophilus YIM-C55.5]|uniref:Dynamin family protein n=1 Tax=Gracilibacillus halophilus YIM-C55.5 TaxID=1308866 RepID=N4W9P5_9BACI|nr:dynamin family protein [Gracilibacillus halophilus]ENH95989.1 Dynamin family protein [Gracilibacillus halophilus YIM-C55.5]
MRQSFTDLKYKTSAIMDESIQFMNSIGHTGYERRIKPIYDQLNNGKFYLTIVGDFSRGKSTFINAFIGKKVLPAKMRPTTAFINRIYQADQEAVHLDMNDTTEGLSLSFDEFKKMTAPMAVDEDSDEEEMDEYYDTLTRLKNIRRANIAYPLGDRLRHVEIYDTPGMNDIYEEREEITKTFIPQADAIIFVLSATGNLTDSEVQFLNQEILSQHIRKVFFVVNFKDRLKEDEDERVMQSIRKELLHIDQLTDVNMYLVSSLEALRLKGEHLRIRKPTYDTLEETGFASFERELNDFFEYEQGLVKVDKPARHYMEVTQSYIEKELQNHLITLEAEQGELVQQIEEAESHLQQVTQDMKQEVENLRARLLQQERAILRKTDQLYQSLQSTLETKIDRYHGGPDDEDIKRHFEQVSRDIKPHQDQFSSELSAYMEQMIKDEVENTLQLLKTKEKHMETHALFQFDMNLDVSISRNVDKETFEELFTTGLVAGGALIGATIFATPIVILAGIGAFIAKLPLFGMVDAYIKRKKLTNAKKEYFKQWDHAFREQKHAVKLKWQETVHSSVRKLDQIVQDNMMDLRETLVIMKQDNKLNQQKIDEKKQAVQHVQQKLKENVEKIEQYTIS